MAHPETPTDTHATSTADRLIGDRDVRERVALSRSQIWRLYSRGEFPAPARIGARSLWSAVEIDAWIKRRLEARGAEARPRPVTVRRQTRPSPRRQRRRARGGR